MKNFKENDKELAASDEEEKINKEENRRRGRILIFGVLPIIMLFLIFCYLFISSLEK